MGYLRLIGPWLFVTLRDEIGAWKSICGVKKHVPSFPLLFFELCGKKET